MGELKEQLISHESETKQILSKVSLSLDEVFRSFSSFNEKPTFVDPYYPDIRSTPTGMDKNEILFWGSLEDNFLYSPPNVKTAIIKDIKIPELERKKRWGFKIISTWENVMFENGVTNFAVTKIKDEHSLEYWLSKGYFIPEEQKDRKVPYSVAKTKLY